MFQALEKNNNKQTSKQTNKKQTTKTKTPTHDKHETEKTSQPWNREKYKLAQKKGLSQR